MVSRNTRGESWDFCGVRTKSTVPNAKHSTEVVFLMLYCLIVVNTVVVWCHEYVVKDAWELDVCTMTKELIKTEAAVANKNFYW